MIIFSICLNILTLLVVGLFVFEIRNNNKLLDEMNSERQRIRKEIGEVMEKGKWK